LHKFHKDMRRSPRGCFKFGGTTHFIADCPKRKKLDSSNKYNNNNWNDDKEEVPLQRQEEEVSKDHVPSVCCFE
jgi:hypothetical protein